MKLSKKELKEVEECRDNLTLVAHLCFIYGLKGTIDEAKSYDGQIVNAFEVDDIHLLWSAVKLSNRFMSFAAQLLIGYMGNDIRDSARDGKRLTSVLWSNFKFLVGLV